MKLTEEQIAAIESGGRTIVSASAGSGKTFVMIQKLVRAIESGVDLDNVLAVTFTKKAAAQMKEKLRSAIIEKMAVSDDDKRAALKVQLSKIGSADISTIHSFCAKLLRTYFYAVGIDGTFGIISSDDAAAKEYKARAIDGLFERYYDEDDENFRVLLKYYRKKRGDGYLKNLILTSYEKLRIIADYGKLLDGTAELYTEKGFVKVVTELEENARDKYLRLAAEVEKFASDFKSPRPEYAAMLEDIRETLLSAGDLSIFSPQQPLTAKRKPVDRTDIEKLNGEVFKKFKDDLTALYKDVRGDISDAETEEERFLKSGAVAVAFAAVLKQFDEEYTSIKRDENVLDYNDLEHLTLALLKDEKVKKEINAKYSCVFVDEYQDVNPVQEEIISRVGGENVFLVGDVKQAIYGFRGSKSLFFAEKFDRFDGGDGNALRLSSNFRSSDGVLDFVNKLFGGIMTEQSCGFDYSHGSIMRGGGGYPEGFGGAEIHIFGKDDEVKSEPEVYSVAGGARGAGHSREGLAVLEIVRRELKCKHYDLKSGEWKDTSPGDICILTRKRNKSADGIVKALSDAGYPVSGAQEADVLDRPEVKQMLDILSYIDNTEQDIPLSTALLSPLGGLSCNDLSKIRIFSKGAYRLPFRECCKRYLANDDVIARRLRLFNARVERLRDISEVLTAAEVIDKILEGTGLEAAYAAGGGEKLKNLRRFAAEGDGLSVSAFLNKLKGGSKIAAPSQASSDSIKIMTMHASKGLEFPVVIIADICATYKGREQSELPFDDFYGFAPRYFDEQNRLTYKTVLGRLVSDKNGREELKNELNLFYVACTRAMCRLHIMAQEAPEYGRLDSLDASSYAKLFDISEFPHDTVEPSKETAAAVRGGVMLGEPDEGLRAALAEKFMRGYSWADSVNLPVKSSASAILRLGEEDSLFRPHVLFGGEGETGTERGMAYHRFLELCDFGVKDEEGICKELSSLTESGKLSEEQRGLLNAAELSAILSMPVFVGLDKLRLFREREFLCRLPANEIMDTSATDGVLVQGAIDLLAETEEGYSVIDYKYSVKSDEELISTYSRQLALYKKAVALIMRVDENKVKTTIVNIFSKRQINL